MSIEYHLKELEIAQNPNDPRRVLPEILDSDSAILDIGCGIGQTFIALNCTDRMCIGLDVDESAIDYGIKNYGDKIQFILSDAGRIPLPSNMLDLVCCRVSLVYTNIPKVITEINRVLKTGGRLWIIPNSREFAMNNLREAMCSRNIKSMITQIYSIANGYCLKYLGFLFPFVNGKYESWQDIPTLTKILMRNGFAVKVSSTGTHTIVEGLLK